MQNSLPISLSLSLSLSFVSQLPGITLRMFSTVALVRFDRILGECAVGPDGRELSSQIALLDTCLSSPFCDSLQGCPFEMTDN